VSHITVRLPISTSGVAGAFKSFDGTAIVACQDHEGVVPHAEFLECIRDILELIVEEIHHGVVDSSIVLFDMREAVLVLLWGLQRIMAQLGVVLKEEWLGLVVILQDLEDSIPENVLLVACAVEMGGWLVCVPEINYGWSRNICLVDV